MKTNIAMTLLLFAVAFAGCEPGIKPENKLDGTVSIKDAAGLPVSSVQKNMELTAAYSKTARSQTRG